MEKFSKVLSSLLVISLIIVIIGATFLKVSSRHREKLLLVVTRKIEEATRKCYLEGNCQEGSTTLGSLISNNYLDKQIHPITKEFIKEELVITCKDYSCKTNIE